MDLNLPIMDRLEGCRSVLVAGMGGGYDVFCGLPIYFELKRRGLSVHLANYSFSPIREVRSGKRLSSTLIGVDAQADGQGDGQYPYFPELHLARWFAQVRGETVSIWCFHKTGAAPLARNYELLAAHLGLDAVVLVDGGVDSLMRGDEAEMGTIVEDAVSMAALRDLEGVNVKLLACTGLGAERGITYAQVFENIARLTAAGAFLGSCALAPGMAAAQQYEAAVLHAQAQQLQEASVINSSMVSALRGMFGDAHLTERTHGSQLWISPLMLLVWFFDFDAVAKHNLYLDELAGTFSFNEAVTQVSEFVAMLPRRPATRVPL